MLENSQIIIDEGWGKYINTIMHGDCLEELKKLPDESIDAIITDPQLYTKEPYKFEEKKDE